MTINLIFNDIYGSNCVWHSKYSTIALKRNAEIFTRSLYVSIKICACLVSTVSPSNVHSINYSASLGNGRVITRKTYDVINRWHPANAFDAGDQQKSYWVHSILQRTHTFISLIFISLGKEAHTFCKHRRKETQILISKKKKTFIRYSSLHGVEIAITNRVSPMFSAFECEDVSSRRFHSRRCLRFDFYKAATKIKTQHRSRK